MVDEAGILVAMGAAVDGGTVDGVSTDCNVDEVRLRQKLVDKGDDDVDGIVILVVVVGVVVVVIAAVVV